ncbi:glycine--tRNA ligase subunit beta [uncultured Sphingomonas sp.]|uniref:glycine--tRNA ligase subunit beta n=1 Tax=uncultured Sphingomonas sp. TaxID=158754 RepID=UPI00374A51EE
MTDFLLELRSEEIPARMQAKAREDLARLFAAELAKAGLAAGAATTYATPRRLTLILRDLPDATEAVSEEVKGPRASAPPQALDGFLRKTGLTREQLTERDGVLYAVTEKPGRATADVLAEAIPAVIRAFPWPKSMRWGADSLSTESLRWVRPLQGIVALFGEQVVPVSIAGIDSGAATLGHRFHHAGAITIGSAADYVEKLRACHVIVDQDERAAIIRDRAQALAAEAGLELVEDEGLVAENAGLTEWPVPLLGRFDAEYLSVPPEVIQLTARVNQKYFVCRDAGGKLANAFVCTANIVAHDGGAKIVEGNRKVLAARLSDARFFYDTDLKVPLEEQAKKLDRIVFHEKLGTVADKVERVAKLAKWLVEEGIVGAPPSPLRGEGWGEGPMSHREAGLDETPTPHPGPLPGGERERLALQAYRAARLAKADLVTGMVGEFPELQGLMGGYYAAAQGEDEAVATAVRDHYKPVGQGDDVPTDPVTVAVSLADKLGTVADFFAINERPSGSRDPFALRRATLGAMQIIICNRLRVSLLKLFDEAAWHLFDFARATSEQNDNTFWMVVHQVVRGGDHKIEGDWRRVTLKIGEAELGVGFGHYPHLDLLTGSLLAIAQPREDLLDFFADRLKVQQREAGVRHDLIDAVFALGGEDDLVRLLARVGALQSFVITDDGANLLAGYKRAANILKKEGIADVDPATPQEPLSYTPEKDEAALIAALDAAEPAAAQAIAREDFEGAMAALATLRAPIDAFFDSVTVNDGDPQKRSTRLNLLARVRAAVHKVADFSRIEG